MKVDKSELLKGADPSHSRFIQDMDQLIEKRIELIRLLNT